MPLIPTAERPATVLPTEAPAVTPGGFPNVLADPVNVAGLPRPESAVAAQEAALVGEAAAVDRDGAALVGAPRAAAQLAAQGETHAAATQRRIEASGRAQPVPAAAAAPLTASDTGLSSPAPASAPPVGTPLDPDAPQPRQVYE